MMGMDGLLSGIKGDISELLNDIKSPPPGTDEVW